MIIKGNLYLNELVERKYNDLIKVITGIRKCGKSFLLFKLYKNIIYHRYNDTKRTTYQCWIKQHYRAFNFIF